MYTVHSGKISLFRSNSHSPESLFSRPQFFFSKLHTKMWKSCPFLISSYSIFRMTTLLHRYQTTVATRGDLPPKHSITMETSQLPRNSLLRRSLRSPAKIIYPSASSTRLSTPPRTCAPGALSPQASSPLSLPQNTSPSSNSNSINRSSRGDSHRTSMRTPSSGMSLSRYRSSSCAPAQCAVSQEDFRKAFFAVPKTVSVISVRNTLVLLHF